jgi:hypothetical protein
VKGKVLLNPTRIIPVWQIDVLLSLHTERTTMSQVTSISRTGQSRTFRWLIAVVGLVIIAAIAYGVFMLIRMNTLPADLDMSTTRASEQAVFRGSWISQLEPINNNQIHTWTIHVETPDGQPIENSQISVDGGMPQHGHGLPTQPQVTEYLGQGNYRVEGMKFNMPGWWVVKFQVTANGRSDLLQFNLMLK